VLMAGQARVVRQQSGLGAVLEAELVQHPGHVALDRGLGEVEPGRDLGIGLSLAQAGEHLHLALGERADQLAGAFGRRLAVGVGGGRAGGGGMSRRVAGGESTVCPSAATRTSPIRSSGGVDLTRNPAAPARSARSTYWSASKVVSTTTTGGLASLTIRSIAAIPSRTRIRRSMSTTSGLLPTTASTLPPPSSP